MLLDTSKSNICNTYQYQLMFKTFIKEIYSLSLVYSDVQGSNFSRCTEEIFFPSFTLKFARTKK